jgi:hypothetical protein
MESAVDLERAPRIVQNQGAKFRLDPISVELAGDHGDADGKDEDEAADDDTDELEGFHGDLRVWSCAIKDMGACDRFTKILAFAPPRLFWRARSWGRRQRKNAGPSFQ